MTSIAVYIYSGLKFISKFSDTQFRLLACLTDNCTENVLQVLKMKHWHTFIFQTLDQYPDIEFHAYAIDFLGKLLCCNDVRIERTFILLCLSYTEIIHAVLRSTRRWIRVSLTLANNPEFDEHFKKLLDASIQSCRVAH